MLLHTTVIKLNQKVIKNFNRTITSNTIKVEVQCLSKAIKTEHEDIKEVHHVNVKRR